MPFKDSKYRSPTKLESPSSLPASIKAGQGKNQSTDHVRPGLSLRDVVLQTGPQCTQDGTPSLRPSFAVYHPRTRYAIYVVNFP